ncbi:glycolate oxidase subunit GlcE [Roseospira visakhapatnamensis]|uniref:Glycolate oxidase FAD binding subunit n=1 Tax=Roseospira visakhapatnamensis TaxID=390880 RepID=A0A7W6WBH8_9PROT|nr:glycolate oxidase subunit GlcE [Roseospira visakhapatnamensis]MBB4267531.1 glycolate oxidase FAD binding subunit [Roseospira visakhapatnamensis]
MSQTYRPDTPEQVADLITWALAESTPLALRGHGTKAALGRPTNTSHALDLSGIAGIVDYAPEELVMTARAGTSMAEVRAALDAAGQMLAFEPPDWRPLLGQPHGPADPPGTLGGLVACNLAGSRRISAGAARDHVLGIAGVSGRGEAFRSGGRVVKNVTGFDLSKLLTGSMGTLAALTELSLKTVPRPETSATVLVLGLDAADAVQAMTRALGSSHEVSGAAHLPAAMAARSAVAAIAGDGRAITALRVEGPDPSVAWRCQALRTELTALGPTEALSHDDGAVLWGEVSDARLIADPADAVLWRLSVPPAQGARVLAAVRHGVGEGHLSGWQMDWGGGLLWLALAPTPEAHAGAVRDAVAHHGGGHATLIRAGADVRAHVPVFQPQPAPLAALSRRVTESFDPKGILSPGRMAEGR